MKVVAIFLMAISMSCIQYMTCAKSNGPLMLTPLIKNCEYEKAINLSEVKGVECYVPKSHAGYITVDDVVSNHLFFWYFPSPTNPAAPLLIWLNGGPGLSSLQGLFWQHGPLQLKIGGLYYSHREDSFVGPFSVVYIDQPVGTGFSYTEKNGYRTTSQGYRRDLVEFIKQFVVLFPQYQNKLDVYIGGQSYAGKYVPHMVEEIEREVNLSQLTINLKGIYLGGPMFDPETLFPHNAEYAFSMGIISKKQLDDYKVDQAAIFEKHRKGLLANETFGEIGRSVFSFQSGANNYNHASDDVEDIYALRKLLKSSYIKAGLGKALNVGNISFNDADNHIRNILAGDMRQSTKPILGKIMNKYKVLIYSGNFDYIVNVNGVEAGLLSTPWKGQAKYQNASRTIWRHNGKNLGYFSKTDNLCRVIIHGAGHNVGIHKPKALRLMMEQFVADGCVKTNC